MSAPWRRHLRVRRTRAANTELTPPSQYEALVSAKSWLTSCSLGHVRTHVFVSTCLTRAMLLSTNLPHAVRHGFVRGRSVFPELGRSGSSSQCFSGPLSPEGLSVDAIVLCVPLRPLQRRSRSSVVATLRSCHALRLAVCLVVSGHFSTQT